MAGLPPARGMVRVAGAALSAVADGRQRRFVGDRFDQSDGLRSTMCNGLGQVDPRSKDGRLWFPSFNGIVAFARDRAQTTSTAARPRLERIEIDGARAPVRLILRDGANEARGAAAPLVLPPDHRTLDVHYTALGSRTPQRLRFRHRLVNFDRGWQEVGAARTARYTRLPPGRYRFELSVHDGLHGWLTTVGFDLDVQPAFHRTTTFAVLIGAALLALGFLLHRFVYLERYLVQLRRMQGEVTRTNERLADKNTELERFAHSVAHDLRNPLTTIQGFLAVLGDDLRARRAGHDDDDLAQSVSFIVLCQEAAQTLHARLEALLELARAGQVVGAPRRIELDALVRQVRDLLAADIRARAATVRVDGHCPAVLGDPERILAVMQNLIENGLKYSRPIDAADAEAPRIVVSARIAASADPNVAALGEAANANDRWVICTISDNGIGLEPGEAKHVFEAFRQLDRSRDGSGIGLALVQRVIEAHGGTIAAHSDGPGHGTTFRFLLPAADSPTGAA
ncbi:MAG: HAMP domain-containing sensor histidine kinase [Acidobacteriota bacterium]